MRYVALLAVVLSVCVGASGVLAQSSKLRDKGAAKQKAPKPAAPDGAKAVEPAPPVAVRPAAVLLKAVRAGEEVRRTFRLTSCRPFTLKSITTSSADITVKELTDPINTGTESEGGLVERTYQLTIRTAEMDGGAFEAEVRIDVESPVGFQLVVPVVGELTQD